MNEGRTGWTAAIGSCVWLSSAADPSYSSWNLQKYLKNKKFETVQRWMCTAGQVWTATVWHVQQTKDKSSSSRVSANVDSKWSETRERGSHHGGRREERHEIKKKTRWADKNHHTGVILVLETEQQTLTCTHWHVSTWGAVAFVSEPSNHKTNRSTSRPQAAGILPVKHFCNRIEQIIKEENEL